MSAEIVHNARAKVVRAALADDMAQGASIALGPESMTWEEVAAAKPEDFGSVWAWRAVDIWRRECQAIAEAVTRPVT